jgi:hypothetical protein
MGAEQRQSVRKPLRIQATLSLNGAEPLAVHSIDIGKFGMGLVGIPEKLAMGEQGLIAFDLFFQGRIYHLAMGVRIAYCIPFEGSYRAGVQFLDLDSASAVVIAKYVEE